MSHAPARLRLGEGRISGALATFLGLLAVGGVLCFHFPQYLTTAEFRAQYPIATLRVLLLAGIVLSLAFGLMSILLSRTLSWGAPGIVLGLCALAMGGSNVEVSGFEQGALSISLDWLVIDSLLLASIFIPLELFLPQRREQTKFHEEWRTDLVYFAISHLLVQFTAMAVRAPATVLFGGVGLDAIRSWVRALPALLALPLAMLTADLFQYSAHRAFHRFRPLWRFHAVHHSIRTIDWLAGSRLHFVDILLTRAFSYIPLYVLGFAAPVFHTYVAIVALQAVAAHANTRLPFGLLKYLLVTPQYHHWHHSDEPRFYDKNFAIHFPFIDRLFGTYYLPGSKWPASTGLGQVRFPKGYLRQFLFPFVADPKVAAIQQVSDR
jgi:lathosterol oxidase